MKKINIQLDEEETLNGLYNREERKMRKKKPCKHKRSVLHKEIEVCIDCKCKIS
jgi:hypothetical protein